MIEDSLHEEDEVSLVVQTNLEDIRETSEGVQLTHAAIDPSH